MPGPGILFQHDASRHCWLPALGGQQYLLLTQDDYSRRVVGALLVARESSWTHLQVVRQTVQRYGGPLAYEVDNHSLVRWVTHQNARYTITTAEADARLQFRRVMQSLDIGIMDSTKGNRPPRARLKSASMISGAACLFCARRTRVRELAEGKRPSRPRRGGCALRQRMRT
jgi:hypothetical protein